MDERHADAAGGSALETEVAELRRENADLRAALLELRGNVEDYTSGLKRAVKRSSDLLLLYD
jgi:hypothetical protein